MLPLAATAVMACELRTQILSTNRVVVAQSVVSSHVRSLVALSLFFILPFFVRNSLLSAGI